MRVLPYESEQGLLQGGPDLFEHRTVRLTPEFVPHVYALRTEEAWVRLRLLELEAAVASLAAGIPGVTGGVSEPRR